MLVTLVVAVLYPALATAQVIVTACVAVLALAALLRSWRDDWESS